ncbi:hypothetical protein F5B21DRAFT_528974 [Xylaria acuta]|nr:hypothetical protein F5B21DRAFT_528974 [Xylaria acuta]
MQIFTRANKDLWPYAASSTGPYRGLLAQKSPSKTKPYIMMISDDKQRRRAAFKLIRSQKFMAEHPGFELGHYSVTAEFEDLQQLGEGHNDMRHSVSDSEDSEEPIENALTTTGSQFLSPSLTPYATQPLS